MSILTLVALKRLPSWLRQLGLNHFPLDLFFMIWRLKALNLGFKGRVRILLLLLDLVDGGKISPINIAPS